MCIVQVAQRQESQAEEAGMDETYYELNKKCKEQADQESKEKI